ncbi:hypothetical protein PAXRUDRAFT_830586 [Paxillus rubicundulus Ve08.2h10]|uniref:Uncharacterized protein n=1 Tax=Paxillus rubicundulus Ve08.2h10 TaxID=930991 RepID=A0A0D0D532_9AGAM|nr:hypothetical protein PAXRUDRAFT_830586 [Paxillus rubicundulus Ve08.2h10]
MPHTSPRSQGIRRRRSRPKLTLRRACSVSQQRVFAYGSYRGTIYRAARRGPRIDEWR